MHIFAQERGKKAGIIRYLLFFAALTFLTSIPFYSERAYAETNAEETLCITEDDLLIPTGSSSYSMTYEDTEPGKRYILFVVKGVIQDVSKVNMNLLSDSLIYMDQNLATVNGVTFSDIIPSADVTATAVISREGDSPVIAGYIIGSDVTVKGYYADAGMKRRVTDYHTVDPGTTAAALEAILPGTGYAVAEKKDFGLIALKTDFSWPSLPAEITGTGNKYVKGIPSFYDRATSKGLSKLLVPLNVRIHVNAPDSVPVQLTLDKEKVVYTKGEEVGFTDLAASAVYDDGSVRKVTGFSLDDSGIDAGKAGAYTYTVTYTESGVTISSKGAIYITEDEQSMCTVRFDTNGGSLVHPIAVRKGQKIQSPDIPVKDEASFAGWYKDVGLSRAFNFSEAVNGDMTLYASWSSEEEVLPVQLRATLSATAYRTGYAFSRNDLKVKIIYGDGSETETDTYDEDIDELDMNSAGAKTVNITYRDEGVRLETAVTFTVLDPDAAEVCTVNFNTGTKETIPEQIVPKGGYAAAPEAELTKAGYVFGGWSCQDKKWNFDQNAVNETMTLDAVWLKAVKGGEDGEIFAYVEEVKRQVYTGKQIKPVPIVMDSSLNILKAGRDYKVTYKNNVNANANSIKKAEMIITAKGNYTGKITMKFTIYPREISKDAGVSAAVADSFKYNKKGVTPKPSVKYGKSKLKAGRDYSITYEKVYNLTDTNGTQTKAPIRSYGYYLVKVTGIGNYTGSTMLFTHIASKTDKPISKAKITFKDGVSSFNYTGSAIDIKNLITVKAAGKDLRDSSQYTLVYDSDNTNPGKVNFSLVARSGSGYYGRKKGSFTIVGLPMKSAAVVLRSSGTDYTGTYVSDMVTSVTYPVTAKNKSLLAAALSTEEELLENPATLVEGRDYTVTYSNNLKAGKATAKITGLGYFSGSLNKKFTINRIDLKAGGAFIDSADVVSYRKAGACPAVAVEIEGEDGSLSLIKGTDYTLTYSGNKKISDKALITVKGKGNYSGIIKKYYSVIPRSMSAQDVRIEVENVKANPNGKANLIYKPAVSIYDGGTKLGKKDFTVDYSGCVSQTDLGDLTAPVRGSVTIYGGKSGLYSGGVKKTYQVTAGSIAGAKVTIGARVYTGEPIVFDLKDPEDTADIRVTVKDAAGDDIDLSPGTDYFILSYKNNTKPGKATVTICGTGAYSGTKKATFVIAKRPIQEVK